VEKRAAAMIILAESAMEHSFLETPLGKHIGELRVLDDTSWYQQHASRYIASFEKLSMVRFPVKASVYRLKDDAFRAFWDDEAQLPRAEYTLTVTEPTWIEHLRPGDSWGSTATDYLD
jgi:hypothetical protein